MNFINTNKINKNMILIILKQDAINTVLNLFTQYV